MKISSNNNNSLFKKNNILSHSNVFEFVFIIGLICSPMLISNSTTRLFVMAIMAELRVPGIYRRLARNAFDWHAAFWNRRIYKHASLVRVVFLRGLVDCRAYYQRCCDRYRTCNSSIKGPFLFGYNRVL